MDILWLALGGPGCATTEEVDRRQLPVVIVGSEQVLDLATSLFVEAYRSCGLSPKDSHSSRERKMVAEEFNSLSTRGGVRLSTRPFEGDDHFSLRGLLFIVRADDEYILKGRGRFWHVVFSEGRLVLSRPLR